MKSNRELRVERVTYVAPARPTGPRVRFHPLPQPVRRIRMPLGRVCGRPRS